MIQCLHFAAKPQEESCHPWTGMEAPGSPVVTDRFQGQWGMKPSTCARKLEHPVSGRCTWTHVPGWGRQVCTPKLFYNRGVQAPQGRASPIVGPASRGQHGTCGCEGEFEALASQLAQPHLHLERGAGNSCPPRAHVSTHMISHERSREFFAQVGTTGWTSGHLGCI